MTRAAIYVRISQDREGAGLGVQRQEQDCRELAKRLGYDVAGLYSDNDTSAYSGKPRPEYSRLLADVTSGRIEAVIVWHTDRLHRSTVELETYIEVAGGIPTYTVKAGHLDLSTASGRMTARITGAVARHESEHKSERQKRKADELVAQGLPLGGGRPFGYESDGLTVRESEAVELRGMVAKVLAGDSLASVMRDLNQRAVLTTRGGKWGYTSTRSLLLRERNCGRMVHRGEVVGMAAWEPIISETEQDAVSALLADPSRRTTTNPARRHLLSGLARCHCGQGMKPGWVESGGKKYWIYTCRERTKGHAHRNMDRVDEFVIGRVLEFLSCVYLPADTEDTAALEVERTAIQTRLNESAVLFAQGVITGAQLASVSRTLSDRSEEISQALNASVRGTALEGVMGITREQWDTLSLDRKRAIIDAVLTIEIHPVNGSRTDLGVSAPYRTAVGRFGWTVPLDLRYKLRASLA